MSYAIYQSLTESISKIAELQFDPNDIIFEFDNNKTPRCKLEQLKSAGFLPTKNQLKSAHLQCDDLEGAVKDYSGPSNISTGVFDILGEYLPLEKKIVIYSELCQLTALRTGLNFEDITSVIIAHEVSHAITHIGRDRQNDFWHNFPECDKAVLEHFAQMYARTHFIETGNSDLLQVFCELSDGQPEIYRSWLAFTKYDRTMLNGSLLWARWYYQNVMHEASTEDVYTNSGIGDDRDFSSKMVRSIFEKLTGQLQLIEKAINLGEVPTKTKNQIDTSLYTIENMVELYFGEENPDLTLNKDFDKKVYDPMHDEIVFVRGRFSEMKHTVKEVACWTKKSRPPKDL